MSALALVPDAAAWPAIQALRCAHDKQVRIWPPHINLLYPFVSEAELELAAQRLAKVTKQLGPLKLMFQRKGRFGSTAFLVPECVQDPGLARLHNVCVSAFPDFELPRRAFVPHLTIGQFKNEADCQAFLECIPPMAIEAEVGCLSLLVRASMQQPFRTAWRVVLGVNIAAVEQGSSQPYMYDAAAACPAGGAQAKQVERVGRQNKANDEARRRANIDGKKETEEKAKLEVKETTRKEPADKACKEARRECNDQASTRDSSPCTTGHGDSMNELPKLAVSKSQDAAREIIASYNKAMPGWEVPLPPELNVDQGVMVDNIEKSKVVGAPQSQQVVSSQGVAESNELGEPSWAARLLQTPPSLPASCKVRIVKEQLNAASIQKRAAAADNHHPKTVNRNHHHSAELPKKLPQRQSQVKHCRNCMPPTGTDRQPKFIKSETVSKPKTDPARWPPVRSGEMEFMLNSPLSISPTRSVCSSSSLSVGDFTFKIMVFPRGTQKAAGKHLGAFVLAEPGNVEPDELFKNVKFEITLVNWANFARSAVKSETFSFKASGPEIDRGWHDFVAVDELTKSESEWVGPTGSVCVRARCQVPSLEQRWSSA